MKKEENQVLRKLQDEGIPHPPTPPHPKKKKRTKKRKFKRLIYYLPINYNILENDLSTSTI